MKNNMKIFRSRERKRKHVNITVEGHENETLELVKDLQKVLRKHLPETSYCITRVDYHQ